MKNEVLKNMIKCVVVLCVIAMLSGALLGLVNQITYVSDEELTARELEKFFSADSFELVADDGEAQIYLAKSGSGDFYVATASGEGGYSGSVPMYLKIVDGEIEELVAGTNQETILSPFGDSYIGQFLGYDASDVSSFGFDSSADVAVDAVTGATKTSTAILNAVNKCLALYAELGV